MIDVATSYGTLLRRLFDDAAIFPPGDTPMGLALAAHRRHQKAWYASIVGPFVCSDRRWPELLDCLTADAGPPIELSLVVTGGLQAVDAAVSAVTAEPRVVLRAGEVVAEDAADAGRVLDRLPQQVQGYVELAPTADLGPLAGSRHRAKLRTGNCALSVADLAQAVVAAVAADVPFKLTGGLHHAVADGAGEHGFLNLLVAVAQALAGRPVEEIAALLCDPDSARLAGQVRDLSAEQMTRVRGQLVSIGTCSISEPLADLRALGLVEP